MAQAVQAVVLLKRVVWASRTELPVFPEQQQEERREQKEQPVQEVHQARKAVGDVKEQVFACSFLCVYGAPQNR